MHYKKIMNRFIQENKNDKKIRNLHSKRPKHYWKILNSVEPKDRKGYPPLSDLHDLHQRGVR